MKKHILSEETPSCPISSSGSQVGVNACTLLQAVSSERPKTALISCVSLARLPILCTLSKSDRGVVITWSPSGYTPVRPDYPEALSSPYLLITMWHLVKVHGVTRNKLKIHVICYITFFCILFFKMSTYGHFPHVSLHLPSTPHIKPKKLLEQQQK